MKTVEQEREEIKDRVSMAYVNVHVTHQQAGQALVALREHWDAMTPPIPQPSTAPETAQGAR